MKPIEVEICLGTTCFVMGAGHLQELAETLPKTYDGRVTVSNVRCFGICNKADNFSSAPYVKIDGDIISSATREKIIEEIEKRLKNA